MAILGHLVGVGWEYDRGTRRSCERGVQRGCEGGTCRSRAAKTATMAWTVTRLLALFVPILTPSCSGRRRERRGAPSQRRRLLLTAYASAMCGRGGAGGARVESRDAPPPQPDPPLRAARTDGRAAHRAVRRSRTGCGGSSRARRPARGAVARVGRPVAVGPLGRGDAQIDASGKLEPVGPGRQPVGFRKRSEWADCRVERIPALAVDGRTLASRRCGDGDAFRSRRRRAFGRPENWPVAPACRGAAAAASTDCGAGAVRFAVRLATARPAARSSGRAARSASPAARRRRARRRRCSRAAGWRPSRFPGVAARGWLMVDDDQLVGASCGVDDAVVFELDHRG